MPSTRRHTLAAALAVASLAAWSGAAFAQTKLKVAAIYTVPVEQQWVSRIDKALKAAVARGEIEYVFSENVSNADYERVMRGYAEKGHTLIVGESFAVEAAARKVAKDYPKVSFLMGSSGKPQEPNFARVRQLHPGAGLPDRHDRRRHDQVEQDRHGRRLPDPRGEPADERLHGRREGDQPEGRVHGQLHQQLVRPAQGQGSRLRDDRQGRRRDVRRAFRRVSDAAKEKGKSRHRQRHQHAGQVPRHGGRLGAVEHGADHRPGDQGGEGRQVQGRRLRRVLDDEAQGQRARAAGQLREEGARPTGRQGARPSRRPSSTASSPSRSTTASPSRTAK